MLSMELQLIIDDNNHNDNNDTHRQFQNKTVDVTDFRHEQTDGESVRTMHCDEPEIRSVSWNLQILPRMMKKKVDNK